MAAGVTLYQLLPKGGMNRVCIGAFIGYGWGSSAGGEGLYAWSSNFAQIETGAGAGYRWRFPCGFFLDLGALAGVGINNGTKWSCDDNPSEVFTNGPLIAFIGMPQLHNGWEF